MAVRLIGKLDPRFEGAVTDANRVGFETALGLGTATEVRSALLELDRRIQALNSQGFLTSFRNYNIFNADVTIDGTNAGDYRDRNNIYGARVDKTTTVTLPTDTTITASGGYPFSMEFTHLAGTTRTGTNNRLILLAQGTDRITTSSGLMNLTQDDLLRGDVAVLTKNSSTDQWFSARSNFDAGTSLLPSGIFEFDGRVTVDATNFAASFADVTPDSGEAYIIGTTGNWLGTTLNQGDVIVAKVNDPSLLETSSDWVILRSTDMGALSATEIAFFNEVTRSGGRFALSENVDINPANVETNALAASGVPLALNYNVVSSIDGSTEQSLTFNDQALQFTDLKGGKLTLNIQTTATSFSGNVPDLEDLVLDYGGGVTFTFPLDSVNADGGSFTVILDIPTQDYSPALNTNCDITLNMQYRGDHFSGGLTITSLVNTTKGTLHDPVLNLIDTRIAQAEARIDREFDEVRGDINAGDNSISSITNRISPLREVSITAASSDFLWGVSTGNDTIPDLSTLSVVNPENPQFAPVGTFIWLALTPPTNYVLRDVTADTEVAIVNPIASRFFNDQSYFVYRVGSIVSGNTYEIDRTTSEEVVAWQADIDNLKSDIERIDTELEHPIINLNPALVNVLQNEVNVDEQTDAVELSSDFNNSLGGTGTQSIFRETSPNAVTSGALNSKPISDTAGTDRARRKLVYFGPDPSYNTLNNLIATDGTQVVPIIVRDGTDFYAQQLVDAVTAGSQTVTLYPHPVTGVGGAGIWQSIPTITTRSGIPQSEASEIFFTNDIPSIATTLSIQYRAHANDNIIGAGSTTLDGVGGGSNVSTSFNFVTGGETATATIEWLSAQKVIRFSVTEIVSTGLPTIQDVQTIVSFNETRTVPGTPETIRDVLLEPVNASGQIFAIKPSSNNTVILVGKDREVDTRLTYTRLFGAGETGHLIANANVVEFLDYEDFEPIAPTIMELDNRLAHPQFGLFTIQYNHDTTVELDTRFEAMTSGGVSIGMGEVVQSVSGTNVRATIVSDGAGGYTLQFDEVS